MFVVLSACAHHQRTFVYRNEALQFTDKVDSSLSKQDQDLLDQVMPLLLPEERKNVIVIRTDDTEVANRVAEEPQPADQHVMFLPSGASRFLGEPPFVPPPTLPKPTHEKSFMGNAALLLASPQSFDTSTGAIHGHEIVNGYSALSADVVLPCKAAKFWDQPVGTRWDGSTGTIDRETGYIYTGGWGVRGTAVDAGFQRASNQWIKDDYQLIIKYSSNKHFHHFPDRFRCDDRVPVHMRFSALQNGAVHISASGIDDGGNPITQTLVRMPDRGKDWVAGGGGSDNGVIVKWMTTIAQPAEWANSKKPRGKPDPPNRLTDGSYFGHSAGSTDPLVVWRNVCVGRYEPSTKRWNFRPWKPSLDMVNMDYPSHGAIVVPQSDSERSAIDLQLAKRRSSKVISIEMTGCPQR